MDLRLPCRALLRRGRSSILPPSQTKDSLSPRRRSGERARERGSPKNVLAAETSPLPPLCPFVPGGEREHASLLVVAAPRRARPAVQRSSGGPCCHSGTKQCSGL